MIAVGRATWDALQAQRIGVKARVRWLLGKDSELGIDVTDDVTQLSPIDRTMAPGLGGYQGTSISVVMHDRDGRFRPDANTSYLHGGEEAFLLTEISVEVGIERADGTFEFVPVGTGFVVYARWVNQQVEIRAEGFSTVLFGTSLAEDFTVQHRAGTGARKGLSDILIELLSANTRWNATSLAVDPSIEGFVEDSGWILHGTFGRGAPVGGVMAEIARSALGTLIDSESGGLRVVGEHMPRKAGWNGEYVPFVFEAPNSGPFEVIGSLASAASEVIATTTNGSGSTSYRNAAIEVPRVGRLTKTLDISTAPFAWQSSWAARLVQTALSFPRIVNFPAHPAAAIVELNDRILVRPEVGGAIVSGRAIGKHYAPTGAFALACAVETASESIFTMDLARYGVSGWAGTDQVL